MPREEMVIETRGGQRGLRRTMRRLRAVVMPDSELDMDRWGLWLTSFDMDEDLRRVEDSEGEAA